MTYIEFLGNYAIHYTLLGILNTDIFVNMNTAVFNKGKYIYLNLYTNFIKSYKKRYY